MMSHIKKLRILIASVVILLAAIMFFMFRGSIPEKTFHFKNTNIKLNQSVSEYNTTNSLIISTNRNFVRFNPASQKTELLSFDGALPDVTDIDVSSDGTKALFRVLGTSRSDVLGARPTQNQPSDSAWWVADFNKKTYKPLGAGFKEATWGANDEILAVGTLKDKNHGLYRSSVSKLSFELLKSSDELLSVYPLNGGGYLLYYSNENDGVLMRSVDGGQEKEIIKGLGIMPDIDIDKNVGISIVYPDASDSGDYYDEHDGEVVLFDLTNGNIIEVLKEGQTSLGYWSYNDSTYYLVDEETNELFGFDISDTNDIKKFKVSTKDLEGVNISRVIGASDQKLFIVDNSQNLHVGATEEALLNDIDRALPNPVTPAPALKTNQYSISYFHDEDVYYVSIFGGRSTYDQRRNNVYAKLKELGALPDLLNYRYESEQLLDSPLDDFLQR